MYLSFDEKLNILKEYLSEHRIPKTKVVYKGLNITKWINELKIIYQNGEEENNIYRYKGNFLSVIQINKIKELGISLDDFVDFNINAKILSDYFKEYKCFPKERTFYKNVYIGRWARIISDILSLGEKSKNGSIKYDNRVLSKKELEILDSIEFEKYISNYNTSWEEEYNVLKDYVLKNGKLPEGRAIHKDKFVGRFLCRQRTIFFNGKRQEDGSIIYENSKLTKHQVDLLNSINAFTKKDNSDLWDKNFSLLSEYKEKYKEFPKANTNFNNFNIGSWQSTQRNIFNNGEKQKDGSIVCNGSILTKEQIDKLNSIGFIWKTPSFDERWEINFNLLKEYLKEHNCYPKGYEVYHGVNIGGWVSTQRGIFNNGYLQEDGSIRYNSNLLKDYQIKKLNDINFSWIGNNIKYYKKEVLDEHELNCKLRYLKLKVDKLLSLNIKFSSKKDVDAVNDLFLKMVYKK